MKNYYIVIMGIAVALTVVISRFLSLAVPLFGFTAIRVGFGFIPIFLIATRINPISGAIVGATADLIGALLFPFGPYFPGFTLTSFLAALLAGYLFKIFNKNQKEKIYFMACFISIAITKVFIMFLNTFWIHVIYSAPFSALIIPRIISTILMIIIISPMVFILSKWVRHIIK